MSTTQQNTHQLELRVYYEDTDASGVVYHANYLRWLERGRTEWLRARGDAQQELMEKDGVAFTIASLQVDFLRPARLDDLVEVQTRIAAARRASLEFSQTIVCAGIQLVSASVRVACVRKEDFRPMRIPSHLVV